MTIPFWCLFVACLLPYVWLGLTAQARKELPEGFDNQNPRSQASRLSGRAAWAIGAQLNAFENLPIFASAVIVNHLKQGDPQLSAGLAIGWVVLRVLHGVFYVTAVNVARTGVFFLALLCALALFFV